MWIIKCETWKFTLSPVAPVMPGTPVGGLYVVVVVVRAMTPGSTTL